MGNSMKDAVVTEIPVGAIRVQEVVRVTKRADRLTYGSCNACTNRDCDTVTNVDLRGMSFRLCDPCRKVLKKAL